MKILPIDQNNKKAKNIAFEGNIDLRFGSMSTDVQNKVLFAIKKEIGDGIVSKRFNIFNSEKIFVGFNYWVPKHRSDLYQVNIATGNDVELLKAKGKKYADSKNKNVDMKILSSIRSILRRFGAREEKGMLTYTPGYSGKLTLNDPPGWVQTDILDDFGRLQTKYTYGEMSNGNYEHITTEHFLTP